jgi:GntR family transcriptional regulator/MocR family aminotransferase
MWGIDLRGGGEVGLSRRIYLAFKDRILTGQMRQGEALPSTRELAKSLGVSRNTVCVAYDMLWTEGFILSRQGAPSRVAGGLQLQAARQTEPIQASETAAPQIRWDFKTGQPDLSGFPWKTWNEMVQSAADGLSAREFAYCGPKGYEPLCVEIARWLLRARGMEVDPKDVFITSGSTQALYLLVEILRRSGRAFALENPSHPGIRTMVADKGIPLRWLPVDSQGADVSALDGQAVSAVYVTPSHQFPLGGILTASRRASLIRLAAENDFYIIEDDYDSEFRYSGMPVSPIYAMGPSRAVYVGTFSKTMFPALRIGFVVLPEALQTKWRHSRNYLDVQNPVLEQAALARFLETRKMDKHIRRMRRLYGEKRDALFTALRASFGDSVVPWGDASGLHVALQFPGRAFGRQFIGRCEDAGIRIAPVSQYCASGDEHTDKLLIGYGHLRSEQIAEGMEALRRIINPA